MQKPTFFYIYDALCGWCFGFSPVIKALHQHFQNQFAFEVINGGMVTGERVGPLHKMAGYIKRSVPRVEEVTGVDFGKAYLEGILNSETYISNSVPPALALQILKEQAPEKQIAFASAIQQLHYVNGQDLNLVETYLPLALETGISEAAFREKFQDRKYLDRAESDFELVQNWGISGFPAVVIEHQQKLYLLTQGYQAYEPLAEILNKILSGEMKQDN